MSVEQKNYPANWWAAFYDEAPFELFLQAKTDEEVERTIEFLREKLRLGAGSSLFDQCCGTGRLTMAFAERGHRLIGVDLCSRYIQMAREAATSPSLNVEFICDDAFTFSADPLCDAAINWWTSFGYAIEDHRNVLMLRRAAESIKSGGAFALDYPNVSWILRNYQQEVIEFATAQGTVRFLRDTTIDLVAGMRRQKWTIVSSRGESRSFDTALRLYLPAEIAAMMKSVGFADIQFYGNIDGSDLTVESPRCIAVGTKIDG